MDKHIVVINGGSSTFKFSVYKLINGILSKDAKPILKKTVEFENSSSDRNQAIKEALENISYPIDCIGHRVVHGGKDFQKPVVISEKVKQTIQDLSSIAPLHNPINLEGIVLAEETFPKALQVAVFDTAFYSTLPEVAYTYPGPWKWREEGIRRFGFHGISHEYCSKKINELTNHTYKKIINCHLGNGCSATAIYDGKAIDTSMGFTPMEGLMMGTRSGSVDPGIILYLQREKGLVSQEIDKMLNKESGLLGIGGAFDMREILKKVSEKEPKALLALDLFAYSLKKTIGAFTAALDGLDILSFTAGIGENTPLVWQKVCEGLKYLTIEIDPTKNCSLDTEISTKNSKVKVFVIHTDEEWQIAHECSKLMKFS